MKTLLFTLLLALTSFKTPSCLQLDLILVGDISYSVRGNEKFISDAFVSFIDRFELSEDGIQIGMILFNNGPYIISNLSSDKESLKNEGLKIRTLLSDNGTKLFPALEASLQEFMTHGYKNHRKIIIIVSDGVIDDKQETIKTVNKLNQLGIQVCGILINTGGSDPVFLKRICNDCYSESDYESLGKELEKLGICL